jgi:hypothetical protein
MPFVLFLLLMLAVGQAQAGPIPVPDTETLQAYAVGVTNDGLSLKAFNYVQDTLGRPHVEEVRYKPMSMDRERFMTEIWSPYSHWCDLHNSD